MTSLKIPETLKALRRHSQMTQEELSRQLHIARQTYSYYESGARVPDMEKACRIADFFHITLDQLVYGLHPQGRDPLASLPSDYQELLHSYQNLSLENQQNLKAYIQFLESQQKQR